MSSNNLQYNDLDYVTEVVLKEAKKEDRLTNQLLITMLSAYSKNPINLLINARSGVGKNYVINKVSALFPKSDIVNLASMTEKALFHRPGILVMQNKETGEYESIESELSDIEYEILEKQKEMSLADKFSKVELKNEIREIEKKRNDLLKESKKLIDLSNKILIFLDTPPERLIIGMLPLLSHDQYEIEYEYVDTHNGIKTRNNVLRGWPAVIIAQALDYSNSPRYQEIQRRFITTNPTMTQNKYNEAIDLICYKNSVPDIIYQHDIVSEQQKDVARDIINQLREQTLAISNNVKPSINNTIIPYEEIIRQSLPREKPEDMTRANRLHTYLGFLPTVHFNKRPRLEISTSSEDDDILSKVIVPIATFEDFRKTVSLMEYSDGVRPNVLEWYYDVLLDAYNAKTVVDSKTDSKGNLKEETRLAVTSNELIEKHKEKNGETLTSKNLLRWYLYPLLNHGYIDSISSVIDARANIYFPVIETKKYKNLFLSSNGNNFSQEKSKIVVNSSIFPNQVFMLSVFESILNNYSQIGLYVKIKNNLDEEITLEELVAQYFGDSNKYFEIRKDKDNDSDTTADSIKPSEEGIGEEGQQEEKNTQVLDKKNNFNRVSQGTIFSDTNNSREITTKTNSVYIDNVNISTNSQKQHKKLFPNAKGNNFLYSDEPTRTICKCYYCPAEFDTPEEHLKHSVNKHSGKPAQPTKAMIEQIKTKWIFEDSTANPIDYQNIEPKGNPWEVNNDNNPVTAEQQQERYGYDENDDGETVTQEELDRADQEILDDIEYTYSDTIDEDREETIG